MFESLAAVVSAEYGNCNGIVIMKDSQTVFEQYFHGFGPDNAHHVASVTKSVLSALIGIAIDEGAIKSIDAKALDFFPEYNPPADCAAKQAITLRHLLTMTAPFPFEPWKEPLDVLCTQADWVRYALDVLGTGGQMGAFLYSTTGAHLLSAILTRATKKSARVYANERLLKPLGLREIPDPAMEGFGFDDLFGSRVRGWVHDPAGNSTGGWGLTMTPRDMARFGQLYLNGGVWNNQRILSPSWIAESIADNPHHYGYFWWLREYDGMSAFLALGDGGNAICCIPRLRAVIAVASSFQPNARDRWPLIAEHILPDLTV